jgi:hypothetical protein
VSSSAIRRTFDYLPLRAIFFEKWPAGKSSLQGHFARLVIGFL